MRKCWYCNKEIKNENDKEHIGICGECYQEMFELGNNFIIKLIKELTNKNKKIDDLKTKKDQQISNIEAKLAEKETRIAELEDKDWYEGTIKQLEEQNERLINKLAESEKETKI